MVRARVEADPPVQDAARRDAGAQAERAEKVVEAAGREDGEDLDQAPGEGHAAPDTPGPRAR